MVTAAQVKNFRHLITTAINPTICIIGILANIFNIIIFTRKHMRSSTNIYLTALAFSDLIYLCFALLELFNYYRFIHFTVPIYFYSYGTILWLKEAFSYISICITITFTIERYVAVRYPIHRQRYCTEVFAKRILIAVFIICILLTATRPFELRYSYKIKGYNAKTDTYCDEMMECINKHKIEYNHTENNTSQIVIICKDNNNETINEFDKLEFENCEQIDYHKVVSTELGKNKTYETVYSVVISILFVVIPVIILTVFNTLLILIVREASRMRKKLTEIVLTKPETMKKKNSKEILSISQENKITIILISIVLVFLTCQIPWAVFLTLKNFTNVMEEQFRYFLAIILNTLVDLTSAINLILYCGLSQEYRSTSKKLFQNFITRASSSVKKKSITSLADSTLTTYQPNSNS